MKARLVAVASVAAFVVASVVPALFVTPVAAAGNVTVEDGTADPKRVQPGETVNNQKVYVVVDNVSADGGTDTYYFEFPNDLASGLSPNQGNVNGSASISSSIEKIEG